MDSLEKVVFYGGVGLVAVLGLIMTIGVLMSDTVETPPPLPASAPRKEWSPDYIPPKPWRDGYGLGDSVSERQVARCAAEAGIPPGAAHTLTPHEFQAFQACVDRKIQAGEFGKPR